tara:strand:- start:1436 stop:2644 length:1209 start_codon:yes stop_codon:yes gene_type:complete
MKNYLTNYRWIIVSIGFTILLFNVGTRYTFGLLLKPISEDINVSRTDISLGFTIFMFVSAISMPIGGYLIDKFGPKKTLTFGSIIGIIGTWLTGYISNQWQIFISFGVIYAFGHAITSIPTISTLINQWFNKNKGIANSITIAGNGTGQLLVTSSLSAILPYLSWRSCYFILSAIHAIIILPLIIFGIKSKVTTHDKKVPKTNKNKLNTTIPSLLSYPSLMLIIIYSICGFQDFFVATHIVAFATDNGISQNIAGQILAFMGLSGIIGVILSGILSDKFGPSKPTLLCFVIRIFIFLMPFIFKNDFSIISFALIYGFTFMVTAPLTLIFVNNIFGNNNIGKIMGTISMVHQITGGLGALFGAIIYDYTESYNYAFISMSLISLFPVFSAIMLKRLTPMDIQN